MSYREKDSARYEKPQAEGDFERLWERYAPELQKKCRIWMAGRPQEADEAFSRVAIVVYEQYPKISGRLSNERFWLLRVAYNTCMDIYRELKHEPWILDGDNLQQTKCEALYSPPGCDNPEQALLHEEFETFLRQSVEGLPKRLRISIELLLDQKCYEEIADLLAISPMNVRKRVSEARKVLRRKLRTYQKGQHKVALERVGRGLSEVDGHAGQGELEALRPEWQLVAQRSIAWVDARGVDRDVSLDLPYRPKRASSRRLANLMAYVERHPSGWKRRFELARHLVENGRLVEAEPHFRHVIQRQPRNLLARLELATILEIMGCTEEAKETYRDAAEMTPSDAVRYHLLALEAISERRFTEGMSALQLASSAEPGDARHTMAIGMTCLRAGRPLAAVASLEAVLESDPESPVALTVSHGALLAAGRPVAARRRVERAVELDPSHPRAVAALLELRITAGQLIGEAGQRTRYLLRRLVRMEPNHSETERLRAQHLAARGAYEEACQVLRDFLDRRPTHARAHLALGRLLSQLGRTAEAAAEALKALELDSSDPAIARRVWPLLATVRHPELLSYAERAISDFGGDRLALIALARSLRSLAPRWALDLTRRVIDLEEKLASGWFAHGKVLESQRRWEEAIAAYSQGWSLLPSADGYLDSTPAALALADLTSRAGLHEESSHWAALAVEHADRARVIDPAQALAWRNLALTRREIRARGSLAAREVQVRPAYVWNAY